MRNSDTHTEAILLSADLYDLGMLEEMEDNDYLVEILGVLFDESPKDFTAMQNALKAGNMFMVCKQAHKLKSSAGVIQAERLTALLTNIENLGKTGSVTNQICSLVEDAVYEYSRIERSLKLYVLKLK